MTRYRASTVPADALAVLDALERIAGGPGGSDFVTAASLVIDPTSGRPSYATAGHPPPLHLTGGGARWLHDVQHPPVGLHLGGQRRASTVMLAPGDVVIVYTDGLVERRGEIIDRGSTRSAPRRYATATHRCPTCWTD